MKWLYNSAPFKYGDIGKLIEYFTSILNAITLCIPLLALLHARPVTFFVVFIIISVISLHFPSTNFILAIFAWWFAILFPTTPEWFTEAFAVWIIFGTFLNTNTILLTCSAFARSIKRLFTFDQEHRKIYKEALQIICELENRSPLPSGLSCRVIFSRHLTELLEKQTDLNKYMQNILQHKLIAIADLPISMLDKGSLEVLDLVSKKLQGSELRQHYHNSKKSFLFNEYGDNIFNFPDYVEYCELKNFLGHSEASFNAWLKSNKRLKIYAEHSITRRSTSYALLSDILLRLIRTDNERYNIQKSEWEPLFLITKKELLKDGIISQIHYDTIVKGAYQKPVKPVKRNDYYDDDDYYDDNDYYDDDSCFETPKERATSAPQKSETRQETEKVEKYLMQTANGMDVRVPESKVDAFLREQKNPQPLNKEAQESKERILRMIWGNDTDGVKKAILGNDYESNPTQSDEHVK